jgi:UV DNA damage endonuclease
MSLGVCCQWLEPRTKRDGSVVYENSINERTLQLGRFQKGLYTKSTIREVYLNNINEIIKLVPKLVANNIKLFRMSSGLFSLAEYNRDIIDNDEQVSLLLTKLGKAFTDAGIRVTTHPDQFVVLSSDNPVTVNNAIKELSHHAWVFDKMHLPATPYAAINIHGGKSDRLAQLIQVVRNLPDNVRSRLTFENDESAYNLVDLLQVHTATGVPVVWDSHHHTFNDANLSLDDAYGLAVYTWKNTGVKPLQHLSNTTPGLENGNFTDRRKHSDYIHYIPDCQRDGVVRDVVDIDVEAKMKNLAVGKLKKFIKTKSI